MKMKESTDIRCIVAENKRISAFAHLLRGIYKISGAKKAFGRRTGTLRRDDRARSGKIKLQKTEGRMV